MQPMKPADLDAQMFVIRNFIEAFYDKTIFKSGAAAGSDLAPSVIKILYAFPEDGKACPIGELGRNARVKSSTITDIIDRLESDGIVGRVRDSRDRRIVLIRLTEKGRKLKRDFTGRRRTELQALMKKLGQKEAGRLIYHLNEAYQLLKSIE
jgi:DNA-binding MarR family transcriptional regulator